MLKIVEKGIIYKGKLYEISKNDVKWLLEENKKRPDLHPARNLRSLAITIYEYK